jgi:hypothetical protein
MGKFVRFWFLWRSYVIDLFYVSGLRSRRRFEKHVTFQRTISTVYSKTHQCRYGVVQYIHRDNIEEDIVMNPHRNAKKLKRAYYKTDLMILNRKHNIPSPNDFSKLNSKLAYKRILFYLRNQMGKFVRFWFLRRSYVIDLFYVAISGPPALSIKAIQ